MKKLSTSLKQAYGKLNEDAVDSKETFFRFGKTAILISKGDEYSEIEADEILQRIFENNYPSFTDMLQELTVVIMSGSQKSKKAKALIGEIFNDIMDNPNVANFYPKLAQALTYDTIATVEAYVDFLAKIAEQINTTTDVELQQYYDTRSDRSEQDIADAMNAVCTPTHALQIIESGMLLYSYILANVSDTLETENLKQFYGDILYVYNDFKEYSTIYDMDITSARNYFTSALSHTDPTFYLSGEKIETIVSDVALPTFLASYMNIFMEGYRENSARLDRYVVPDILNKFKYNYNLFLDTNKIYQAELFIIPGSAIYGSKRLKQYYYAGLQITAKIKNMTNRRIFMNFLNYAKPVIDDILTIEERTFNLSGGGY